MSRKRKGSLTIQHRQGQVSDGRVVAITAFFAEGRRPFAAIKPPTGLSPEAFARWQARGLKFAQLELPKPAPKSIRRISRTTERSHRAKFWAIPPGSVIATHTSETWRALISTYEFEISRSDRKKNIEHVLWILPRFTDFDSMTVRITWNTIIHKIIETFGPEAKIGRSTVGSVLYDLRAWGLIGIVASGRSAAYAAKAGQKPQDDAPVYVLCRPFGRGLRIHEHPDAAEPNYPWEKPLCSPSMDSTIVES